MHSQYFDQFKKVRNYLKKFSSVDVFDTCMEELKRIWNLTLNDLALQNKIMPWKIFIIMKWALIYSESSNYNVKSFKYRQRKDNCG